MSFGEAVSLLDHPVLPVSAPQPIELGNGRSALTLGASSISLPARVEGWDRPHVLTLSRTRDGVSPPTDIRSVLGELLLVRRDFGCCHSVAAIHPRGDGSVGCLQEECSTSSEGNVSGMTRSLPQFAQTRIARAIFSAARVPASVREATVRSPTPTALCRLAKAGRSESLFPGEGRTFLSPPQGPRPTPLWNRRRAHRSRRGRYREARDCALGFRFG